MKIQVNRKHFVEIDNIKKLLIKKNGFVWVYVKSGFPQVLICRDGLQVLKNRLVNNLHTIFDTS